MLTLLFFTFLSGLVTIFAPCIWPILPIVLSSGVSGEKRKPLGLVTGLAVSFIFFTLTLATIVKIIPFDPESLRYLAVVIIGFLGIVLLVPWFGDKMEVLVSRFSSVGGRFTTGRGNGFGGGFITGAALGMIWTPCAGPILAAVATLAATQAVGFQSFLLIVVYVAGVCVPLYILTVLGGRILTKTRTLSQYTGIIQRVFGAVMILSAFMIFSGFDKKLQIIILEKFPSYGSFVSVFENKAENTGQLEVLRTGGSETKMEESTLLKKMFESELKNLGAAPELVGINDWLNTEGTSLKQLRGKVVLIDFWTYSCINCIRTLPHVTSWYEKYKDQGFVVIGVHTPEFAFEHKRENVAEAIKKYNITYPVAQDNDYTTWRAYSNRYWPAHYLIDAEGNIRRTHFGEGEYDETEAAIVELLKEAGKNPVIGEGSNLKDETPKRSGIQTPETYLGSDREERLVSPETVSGVEQVFTAPNKLRVDEYALSGSWKIEAERALASSGSELSLRFMGEKVFLVMSPLEKGKKTTVNVYLDDKKITTEVSGIDVKNGTITVDQDRLYEIIDFKGGRKEAVLKLQFEDGTTAAYAFTFA